MSSFPTLVFRGLFIKIFIYKSPFVFMSVFTCIMDSTEEQFLISEVPVRISSLFIVMTLTCQPNTDLLKVVKQLTK